MSIQVKPRPQDFDGAYYQSGNYQDYSEREPRYHQMAREVYHALHSVGLISSATHILDYGCAFGFLVRGFQALGIKCSGYDISRFAAGEAMNRGIEYRDGGEFDLITCLDVLEHMEDEQIDQMLRKFKAPKMLVRIPISTDGKTFHLAISRADKTHINCRLKEEWLEFFEAYGFKIFLPLSLYSIYDSSGVMAGIFIRA